LEGSDKKKQSYFPPDLFLFLNKTKKLSPEGSWNSLNIEKLWQYNLHYFDDLTAVNAEERNESHEDLINSWIVKNPVGIGEGWEAYPLSLRIVNWIKWHLWGNNLSESFKRSLVIQIRFLNKTIEYHLLGNHLFENAKALIFGGLFFCGDEPDKWLNKGLCILTKELKEQILIDGGHFELSPLYHSIVLEGILDIFNISKAFPGIVPVKIIEDLETYANKMRKWYFYMSHPDGHLSFFNDAVFNIAADFKRIEEYASRLGLEKTKPVKDALIYLKDSGCARIQRGKVFIIADVGNIGPDYLPGHAHADTLSFELSVEKQRVIVNSGVSQYESGHERQKQRGTGSHNTLMVDGISSSETWSSFRVAKRAKIAYCEVNSEEDENTIKAGHDGYCRLRNVGLHHRSWKVRTDEIELIDIVDGKGSHEISVFFHFYPGIVINNGNDMKVVVETSKGKQIGIFTFLGNIKVNIEDGFYYPEFGIKIPNKKLIIKSLSSLPFRLKSILTIN
jgi:uncharacterized heparinase superfamily protein